MRDTFGDKILNLPHRRCGLARPRSAHHYHAGDGPTDAGRSPSPRSLALPGTGHAHRRLGALLGVQHQASGAGIASTSAARFVVNEVHTVRTDLGDEARFMALIDRGDPYRETSANRLLKGLRGKDVLSSCSSRATGRSRCRERRSHRASTLSTPRTRKAFAADGFSSRSGWLTSSPRSAEVAGSRTPRCSQGFGSTTQAAIPS